MIIGHVGVAYAAKWRWSRVPLGALLVATLTPDILREAFAAAGLGFYANLYSHALPYCLGFALCAGILAWRTLLDATAGVVVTTLVLSHVALDMISGGKPLWAGGPVGLSLERVEQLEFVVEVALLMAGWILMRRTSRPRWTTRPGMLAFLIALETVYLVGTMSARPYARRCLASPFAACTDHSLLTTRWRVGPFFFSNIL